MADKGEIDSEQFFRLVQQTALPGFTLTESVSKKDFTVPAHLHEETHITLMLEGNCQETYMGRARELAPLKALYFHPGESHSLRVFDEPIRTFDIELDSHWLDRLLERPVAPTALLDTESHSISWLVARLYKEFKEADDVSQLAMEGLALEMLADLARASRQVKTKREPRWLHRVVEIVRDEFARPLALSELARTVDVHPTHLAEVFRQHYQCTLGEFIRRTRVEQAIRQMADHRASLADISLAAGFSDQSHFSRVFKRITGMTPAQFRHLHFSTNPVQNTRESCKTDKPV